MFRESKICTGIKQKSSLAQMLNQLQHRPKKKPLNAKQQFKQDQLDYPTANKTIGSYSTNPSPASLQSPVNQPVVKFENLDVEYFQKAAQNDQENILFTEPQSEQLRWLTDNLIEQRRQQLGVLLPQRHGELITADGQILLSMDCSFGTRKQFMAKDSVHLYLGGIVRMQPNNIAQEIENYPAITAQVKEVEKLILAYQHENQRLDKLVKTALKNTGNREATTREMLGMAYHMAYNCQNHFARAGNQFVLKHYVPQTQARHTIDKDLLFTRQELENCLALVPLQAEYSAQIQDVEPFRAKLRQETSEHELKNPTYAQAKEFFEKATDGNPTGWLMANQPKAEVHIEQDRQLCTPMWSKNINSSPIKMAINETLPIRNDLEMLQGGLIYDATLHEMLMSTKKTLAVKSYNEMAARLTTPGAFPFWLLYDVPLGFAGKCVEHQDFLKSFNLQGPVVMEPIACFKDKHLDQGRTIREQFTRQIPKLMKAVSETFSTLYEKDKPDAVKFIKEQSWICEIVYGSNKQGCAPIRITTNIRLTADGKNEILLRDPGATRSLWPPKFFGDYLRDNPQATYLDVVKQNPAMKNLDDKHPTKVNRHKDYSPTYHNVCTGNLRLRTPDYITSKSLLKDYFKGKYPRNLCYKNIMKLLFNNVEFNTFNKGAGDEKQLFEDLDSYRVTEIILGLPVIKEQNKDNTQLLRLYKDHDRACKTSNELGLHWARCDKRREPFQVLLNLEQSHKKQGVQFDAKKKVTVSVPDNIFTGILNKSCKFSSTIGELIRNRPQQVNLLSKSPPFMSHVKILLNIEHQVNSLLDVEEKVAEDSTLQMLINSPVSYKFKDIYKLVSGYVNFNLNGASQQSIINVVLHYIWEKQAIPVAFAIKRGDENEYQGFVPMWPQLWQTANVFKYGVKFLMLRFNNGRKFGEEDFRIVTIKTEEAFKRVIVEIVGQLCSWLMRYDCYRTLEDFLLVILRFQDVVPNYFYACCARLNVSNDLYKRMSESKWGPIIQELNEDIYKHLSGQSTLPKPYQRDFFASDYGYQQILNAAQRQPDDKLIDHSVIEVGLNAKNLNYEIFAAHVVEQPLRQQVPIENFPNFDPNYLQNLAQQHGLRPIKRSDSNQITVDLDPDNTQVVPREVPREWTNEAGQVFRVGSDGYQFQVGGPNEDEDMSQSEPISDRPDFLNQLFLNHNLSKDAVEDELMDVQEAERKAVDYHAIDENYVAKMIARQDRRTNFPNYVENSDEDMDLVEYERYAKEYEDHVQGQIEDYDQEMAGDEFDAAIDIGEEHMMDSEAQNASTVVSLGQPQN